MDAPDGAADAADAPAPADVEASGAPYSDVYDLADRGQSPRQIAQELNRPDGEIELILALRHTRP